MKFPQKWEVDAIGVDANDGDSNGGDSNAKMQKGQQARKGMKVPPCRLDMPIKARMKYINFRI